jgi:hypothetical protein
MENYPNYLAFAVQLRDPYRQQIMTKIFPHAQLVIR